LKGISLLVIRLDNTWIDGHREHEDVRGAIIIRCAQERIARADPMPGGAGRDGEPVQSIGVAGPGVMPALRVAGLDLGSNQPRLADLRAEWRVIDGAQKLPVELRIVEIDCYVSCSLITILSIPLQNFHRGIVSGDPAHRATSIGARTHRRTRFRNRFRRPKSRPVLCVEQMETWARSEKMLP